MINNQKSHEFYSKEESENIILKIKSILNKTKEQIHLTEFYLESGDLSKIEYEQGAIKSAKQRSYAGLGVRVISKDGKQGISFTSDFSEKALEFTINAAKQMMKAAVPNPDFVDLPSKYDHYPNVEGIIDKNIFNLDLTQLSEKLNPIFELKKKPIAPIGLSGDLTVESGSVFVWNSNEISAYERYSNVGLDVNLSLLPLNGGSPSSGFSWGSEVSFEKLNSEKIAEDAYNMAKQGLKKTSLPTGKYPILLSPIGASSMILETISSAINGEAVANQFSFLAGKLNEIISSSLLTVKDLPHLANKVGSTPFDDEGVPTIDLPIIEKGILKNYYHNSFSANKSGVPLNAHATRSSYAGNIGIGSHNLIMEPGNTSYQSILEDIKKGILFVYTGDHPNGVTGDFSGLIMTGYLIKNGEIGPALSETLIGINLIDMYKNISAISKEQEWIGSKRASWVLVDNVSVAGR